MRAGDTAQAIELARRARTLRPKTPWVLSTLFELETRAGHWREAAETLARAQRARALPIGDVHHHEATLLIEMSRAAAAENRARDALQLAEQAHRADPEHEAASLWLAECYVGAGKMRAAERVIEQEWARRPHPDLLVFYRQARPVAEPLQWVKQVERLARLAPLHRDSMVALGAADLDAKLWGEARRHLGAAIDAFGGAPPSGICRLMARLEEEESKDSAAVRRWLARAAEAPPDPAWVCGHCGAAHARWQANCARCGSFDRLAWQAPARVQPALVAAQGEGSKVPAPVPTTGTPPAPG